MGESRDNNNPQDARTAAATLIAAFDQRLHTVGGQAAMLDSVVEIAREAGYNGDVDEAVRLLQPEFEVYPLLSGQWMIWRKSES